MIHGGTHKVCTVKRNSYNLYQCCQHNSYKHKRVSSNQQISWTKKPQTLAPPLPGQCSLCIVTVVSNKTTIINVNMYPQRGRGGHIKSIHPI